MLSQNKFIRVLFIINGLIIPVFVLIFLGIMVNEWIGSFNQNPEPTGIIVGEELDSAKNNNLILQGIEYGDPKMLPDSSGNYMEVFVKTYQKSRYNRKMAEGSSAWEYHSDHLTLNLMFFDKEYHFVRRLLSKKASIYRIQFAKPSLPGPQNEIDSTIQNILYLIAFEDSNKDGLLDSYDDHDLFISDFDGENLKKITNNIEIENFYFQNRNSEVFISYKERSDEREEYKRLKFALYNIERNSLKKLDHIEKAMDELEVLLSH
ncbi:hypothetical protein [Flexithrix dorotheae]|uniref:hypothetical protein n=1 Tax=Flexithrix dorotheae TaxID=70993 RepID=UPI000373C26A|nr:hypothetical protein [Flexithrix dorotheae]